MTARHLVFVLTTMLSLLPFTAAGGGNTDAVKPPVAKKIHTEKTVNGTKLVDDYAWLRDKNDPDVKAYLQAENAYTGKAMASTEALRKKLYREMLSHIKQVDTDVPFKDGEYYYYSRSEKGKQYRIYCRKKGSTSAREEIILDLNRLAAGQKFMALGGMHVSEDGNLLAYSTDNTGYRQYRLHIKDLLTGKTLADQAEKTGSIAWANDNRTLFYTVEDATKRQYRLYRHNLGSDSKTDSLIYEEADERFVLNVDKTRSRKFLLLSSGSHTTTEYRYLPADRCLSLWQIALPRKQDVQYSLDHGGDRFYLRINDTGRNFRLVTMPVGSFAESSWKELIPSRKDTMLVNVEVFKDFLAVEERFDGLPRLRVIQLADGSEKTVPVPEPTYSMAIGENAEFDTGKLRYNYESLVTPESVYDFDIAAGLSTLLKREEIPGGYDPSRYESLRVFATAGDGTRIPISLVYRKDMKMSGENPLYLTAYGSYGLPVRSNFNSDLVSLLDRGVVVAKAHIRGGGDMGKPWHDAGRMMNKKNTFSDFIAATEFLVKEKYGAADRVAIRGASAGGLLMGAVVNLRPDLFRAVIMSVPFVDVINTMLDPSLPLTVGEFEEWGNPQEKPAFDYMLSYSPYNNLVAGNYPAILVKTSFNDSQVGYWEPAKYVAKLRTLKADKFDLLFLTNMNAGHGGSSGRYDHLQETAFDYAFLLRLLGVE